MPSDAVLPVATPVPAAIAGLASSTRPIAGAATPRSLMLIQVMDIVSLSGRLRDMRGFAAGPAPEDPDSGVLQRRLQRSQEA